MNRVAVVLPAYNEALDLLPTLENVTDALVSRNDISASIIVVDDGSSDDTAAIAERFTGACPVTVLRHSMNKGLGAALQTGFTHAVLEADIIVTMDADCSHDARLIHDMIREINADHDVVIASRFVAGGDMIGVSAPRKMLSAGARMIMSSLFPHQNVRDYSSGFRAYRASILKALMTYHGAEFITEKGFACQIELLLKLREFDVQLTEVPLVLRYDQKAGESKMKIGRTISRYGCVIARNVLPDKTPRASLTPIR